MIKIEFRIGGRRVDPNNIGDAIQAALLESVREDLRAKIGSIRDPDTGEFPVVVVKGRDFEHLTVDVEGSEKLVELVRHRLGLEQDEGQLMVSNDRKPVAFLCHASEDKAVVRRLAQDLLARGIDVFFDEWEIRAGDSLRQKIDKGLEDCTHFIAVLSATSIGKPWVNSEMDAGFVMRLQQQVAFIPLRLRLDVAALPPLLRGISAPAIDDYEPDVERLVSDIHGLSRKPLLGPVPSLKAGATQGIGLSPAAETLVKLFVDRSRLGVSRDPQIDVGELRRSSGLTHDDLVDAADELEGQGFVRKRKHVGCDAIGFAALSPEGELFARFDKHFQPWNPEEDALLLATKLMESKEGWVRVADLAGSLAWEPRRMNPALHYLMNRRLVEFSNEAGTGPWATSSLYRRPETRRFARGRGQ